MSRLFADPSMILTYLVFAVFWIFSGVGCALFIVYKALGRYNDFGDSIPGIDEYSKKGIHFNRNSDDVDSHEKRRLFEVYGSNPYEGIKRSIPEQLVKNGAQEKPDTDPWSIDD